MGCLKLQTASEEQYLSQEPTGRDGPNLYWALHNNPLINVDPDGLEAIPATETKEEYDAAAASSRAAASTTEPNTSDYVAGNLAMTAVVYAGVRAVAAAPAVAWAAFRKNGFLNSNRYLRIGFSRNGGRRVFRIAGDLVPTESGHIILKDLGPLGSSGMLPAMGTVPDDQKNSCP